MKLYHCTDAGDELDRDGFMDTSFGDSYRGVFLSDRPVQIGMFAIEVEVPEDVASVYRADLGPAEWCIPADILNALPRRRLEDY